MMQAENDVCDFVKKVIENHEYYNKNRSVINLMNFFVYLFIFADEKILNNITDDWISIKLLKDIKKNTNSNFDEDVNLKNIYVHIKKGIELFYLNTKTDEFNNITTLIIEDKTYKNGKNYRFKIIFSTFLLENFYLEFSNSIIKYLASRDNSVF